MKEVQEQIGYSFQTMLELGVEMVVLQERCLIWM